MSYHVGKNNSDIQITTSFDLNASTATASFNLDGDDLNLVAYQLVKTSGTYTSVVVDLYCSLDDVVYNKVPSSNLSADGISAEHLIGAPYVQVQVTTVNGGAAAGTITLYAKR